MICYLATNKLSGARYVGVTRRRLAQRVAEHVSHAQAGSDFAFHRAIVEFGREAFCWSVLAVCADRELLLLAEQEAVDKYRSRVSQGGYNMTSGGSGIAGYEWTQEKRAKLSESIRARPPISAETRAKLSAALKGRRPPEPTFDALRKKMKDPEVRARCKAAAQNRKKPLHPPKIDRERCAETRRASEKGRAIPLACYEQVKAMQAAGSSLREIGLHFGCNPATVFYYLKRMGTA